MKPIIVYFDERQQPDVLTDDGDGHLADSTTFTDEVVDVVPGVPTRVVLVWNYAMYDIPITDVAWAPTCQRRDPHMPLPVIGEWKKVIEKETGKWVGLTFVITAAIADAWPCNVQTVHKYYNEEMGREYTHRRSQTFTISSQPPAGLVLDKIADSWTDD